MDRRNFLSQSFVTMGTYAISFSSFATMDFGGVTSIRFRPGIISQKEFEAAAHKASLKNTALVLHHQTKIQLSKDTNVACSILGNGGSIQIAKGSKLTLKGDSKVMLKATGVNFNGEVIFAHPGDIKVTQNQFINNYGDALVLDTNSSFEVSQNKMIAQSHGIVVLRNNKGLISSNTIEVKGNDGQFIWAENSFNLEVLDNTFANRTKGSPTVGVANDHDLNPNLTLRNNRIA